VNFKNAYFVRIVGIFFFAFSPLLISKPIPKTMGNVISTFLEQKESMTFTHEIVKTNKILNKFDKEYPEVEQAHQLYTTKSPEELVSEKVCEKDLYKVLSITPESSEDDIKAAYEKTSKEEEFQEAFDVLSQPIKRSYYDLQRDTKEFIDHYRKILFDDRMNFMHILYENRSFVDGIFKVVLDDVEDSILMTFIMAPSMNEQFFTANTKTLSKLKKVCYELSVFSGEIEAAFSPQVKKNFNSWIKEQNKKS